VTLLPLILFVLVLCLVLWAVQRLLAAFSVAEPIRTVIWVIVVLIVALYALQRFGMVGRL
jgi:hypothetical protein